MLLVETKAAIQSFGILFEFRQVWITIFISSLWH